MLSVLQVCGGVLGGGEGSRKEEWLGGIRPDEDSDSGGGGARPW